MRALSICLLSLLLASAAPGAGEKIENLTATAVGTAVTVRFHMANAFADEERVQALQSGLPTGFTYVVDFYRDRPNWLDDGIARSRIEVVATFNSVTREYLLNYRRDRRLVRSETLGDLPSLEARMTSIAEENLFDTGGMRPYKLKVRVKADIGRGWMLYLIPWQISTRWQEARVKVLEPKP